MMTALEATLAVVQFESRFPDMSATALARRLQVREVDLRTGLLEALCAGFVRTVYVRSLPFGERDCYRSTYDGRKAVLKADVTHG